MRTMPRPGSPLSRSSTLITSAPRSASIALHTGPCCQIVQSTTRIPSSGIGMAEPSVVLLQVVRACEAVGLRVDAHVDDGHAVGGERAQQRRPDLLGPLDVLGVTVD